MEQKFSKKRLNSDLGLNLRIFEPKDLGEKKINSVLKKMEQKFRKNRLNSDLGLNLRSLEQKFRKKTRKFRPRSLQPKKDQVKNA